MGHTHEDIDACFGTLASWFSRTIIQTPQGYKEAIEEAFVGGVTTKGSTRLSNLKCNVIDVLIVPNYQLFSVLLSIHILDVPTSLSGLSISTVLKLLREVIFFLWVQNLLIANFHLIKSQLLKKNRYFFAPVALED